jgi:hypothetical protein
MSAAIEVVADGKKTGWPARVSRDRPGVFESRIKRMEML